jgi:hypothetical protein
MQEFQRITARLSAKASAHGDMLTPAWLPRVAAYASAAALVRAHAAALLDSPAVKADSEEEQLAIAAALTEARAERDGDGQEDAAEAVADAAASRMRSVFQACIGIACRRGNEACPRKLAI